MPGIMTNPPAKGSTRVSPGVYRSANGSLSNSSRGSSGKKGASSGGGSYEGLNKNQNKAINQRQSADIKLGKAANGLLPRINQAYQNPFDFSQLPSAPVSGDFNTWRQQQIDASNNDFTTRMNPVFKQQTDDFEQQMANRGIPMGSDLYNQQKQQLLQSQNDQRQSMLATAMGQAGQNAEQFFNVGTQARGNALNEGLMQRNMPLNEFNALYAGRSPMDMQNLAYSQGRGMANLQGQIARSMPRGGRGGGGDPYNGFGSQEALWAAQDARTRANQMWMWQNQPKGPSGPSTGSQIAGGLLGIGGALAGNYIFG